jgi:hypothetical protein
MARMLDSPRATIGQFSDRKHQLHRSKESAAFAEPLAEVFPTDEERAAHERAVAELVASLEAEIQSRRVAPSSSRGPTA